jgi:DNA-binding SARP family transcriptional activator
LIGHFELSHRSRRLPAAPASERLLAFLALRDGPAARTLVAGMLWPETTDARAGGNLRSTLWRLAQLGVPLVAGTNQRLSLDPSVAVDLRQATAKTHRLMDERSPCPAGLLTSDLLLQDVLPDWDEEWLRKTQESFRQRRMRALEALARRLTASGRHWEAVDVAMEAVAVEPLRESAHRILVAAHLADGNWGEAQRQYRWYRDLLWMELGVEPSPAMVDLVTPSGAHTELALVSPAVP